jgi:uncharacterized protein YjbI with pentapeptide repeats
MTSRSTDLHATKQKPMLLNDVKFDIKTLFVGLTKGIIHLGTGNFNDLGIDAAEVLAGLGLETTVENAGYALIERAVSIAAFELTKESLRHFEITQIAAAPSLSAALSSKLENLHISLTGAFLDDPKSLPLLQEIAPIYEQWLVDMGVAPKPAQLISRRFDSYFVHALVGEWRNNPEAYKELVSNINTPFRMAEERERDWENYFAMLDRRTHENVFDEPFSLAQIYVPLNAFYIEHKNSAHYGHEVVLTQHNRKVVNLESSMIDWVKNRPKTEPIRILSGGPGSGKSSFTKMFCAKLCAERLAKPIYIPLHLINPTNDIGDEVRRFVADEGFLRFDPLSAGKQGDILLIFDGLDELANQGESAARIAQSFVRAVQKFVDRRAAGANRLQVLISGRELVIQETGDNTIGTKPVFTLLPYVIPVENRTGYDDPLRLLEADGRDKWWATYGELTEEAYSGLPDELKIHEIDEITAQPLLNYLVTLSYKRGRLDFHSPITLNRLYDDLVAAVYERAYEGNRIFTQIEHMSRADFHRVLEEVGVLAWHSGDGRSTSVSQLQLNFDKSGLAPLLKTFEEGAEAGVINFLAAFFFRHSILGPASERTFVFTHKSFGEYLAAKRIVRELRDVVAYALKNESKNGNEFTVADSLAPWAALVGREKITPYIRNFLIREIEDRPESELRTWHAHLSTMLSRVVDYGMPMERLKTASFGEATFQNNNASECLVIALNACADTLNEPIRLNFLGKSSFGTFLRRVCPQRMGEENPLLYDALSYFDLSNQSLEIADLFGANLAFTQWTNVSMAFANLAKANLSSALMDNISMTEVDLSACTLTGAKLRLAQIRGSKLRDANFTGADLSTAVISYCDVTGAVFTDAILTGLQTSGTDFAETIGFPANLGDDTDQWFEPFGTVAPP